MDRSVLDRPAIDRRMMLLSRSRREHDGDSDSEEAYSVGRDDVDRSDSLSRAFAQQATVGDYRGRGGDSRQVREEEEEEEDEEEYTVEVWDALDSLEQVRGWVKGGAWPCEEQGGEVVRGDVGVEHLSVSQAPPLKPQMCVLAHPGSLPHPRPLFRLRTLITVRHSLLPLPTPSRASPRSSSPRCPHARVRQLKPIIASGPRWKLEEFLRAIDILQEMAEFFERNECASCVRECEKYMAVAMDHLVDEFRDALVKISKPLPAAMLREVAMSAHAGRLVDQHQGGAAAAAAAVLAGAAGPGVPRTSTGSSSASSHLPTSRSRTANTTSSPDSSGSSSPVGGGSAMAHAVSAATHLALQDWLSASAVPFLHRMAVKLAQGGESQRCMQQYVKVRAEAIQRSVDALDIKRVLTTSLEEMTWQQLEALMKGWVTDMRAMVLVLLGSERVLCDEIFDSLEPDRELCYLSLIQASGLAATVEAVVSNGRVVASGRNTPERLFALLDMFTTGRELRAQIEAVVSVPGFGSVLREMERLPRDLAGAVMDTIGEFKRVLEEPPAHHQAHSQDKKKGMLKPFLRSASASSGADTGPVEEMEVATAATHPLTSYVVNYMNNLLDKQSKRNYPVTLEYLLLEYGRSITSTGTDATAAALITRSGPQYKTPFSGAAVERRSGAVGPAALGQRAATLAGVVSSVLESLLRCLESRAKAASDPTQGALFLLNNALYISKNLSDGKLSAVADLPDWKDGQMLDKYMIHFRDAVLARISHALEETAVTGGLLKSVNEHTEVKAKLKKFNAAFEELAIKQAGWNIPDEDRRKKTRSSVARRLREIYSAFLLPYRCPALPILFCCPQVLQSLGLPAALQVPCLAHSLLLPTGLPAALQVPCLAHSLLLPTGAAVPRPSCCPTGLPAALQVPCLAHSLLLPTGAAVPRPSCCPTGALPCPFSSAAHREELCEFKTYRYSPDAIERVVLDYFFLATPSRGLPISFG
ncbi:unnamed protein product [Closterium sp. Naga37s-1]|nr:unnamed protein product [Closterium sp. Naga37s-1]